MLINREFVDSLSEGNIEEHLVDYESEDINNISVSFVHILDLSNFEQSCSDVYYTLLLFNYALGYSLHMWVKW